MYDDNDQSSDTCSESECHEPVSKFEKNQSILVLINTKFM